MMAKIPARVVDGGGYWAVHGRCRRVRERFRATWIPPPCISCVAGDSAAPLANAAEPVNMKLRYHHPLQSIKSLCACLLVARPLSAIQRREFRSILLKVLPRGGVDRTAKRVINSPLN